MEGEGSTGQAAAVSWPMNQNGRKKMCHLALWRVFPWPELSRGRHGPSAEWSSIQPLKIVIVKTRSITGSNPVIKRQGLHAELSLCWVPLHKCPTPTCV